MTERGSDSVWRERTQFLVGPSRLRWTGQALIIQIDEREPLTGRRVRGEVVVHPSALSRFQAPLDAPGRHRWGPIAPCSRVEVALDAPSLSWKGSGYLDSNEGDEPIDTPFREWDWARATLADGRTAVIYDVQPKQGGRRVVSEVFHPDGSHGSFEAPPRTGLPASAWRVPRHGHGSAAQPPRLRRTLEDTPFYVRSELDAHLMGERVVAVHETLSLPRLVSPVVQAMLPVRMPRRA